MDSKTIDRFIDSWGEMGALWGLNSSMARIHALLIVSEKPLSLDFIAKKLKISRGNASMCLKELRNWGVIKRVKIAGDRKDYYVTVQDVWQMFFSIARERKRREFNPTLSVVREALAEANKGSDDKVVERLKQMTEFLTVLDNLAERFLEDESKAKFIMDFLAGAALKMKS